MIVDPTGMSVADSEAIGGPPQDFSNRPEIQEALRGGRANGVRQSETAGTGLVFVAIPVVSNGVVHGAVRITYPTSTLDARVRSNWIRLGVLSALVLLVVTAVGVVMARSVSRPVRRMQEAAHRMALGDLTCPRADRRRPAGASRPRGDFQSHARSGSRSSSTPNGASSPTRRISCAHHSLRCGFAWKR